MFASKCGVFAIVVVVVVVVFCGRCGCRCRARRPHCPHTPLKSTSKTPLELESFSLIPCSAPTNYQSKFQTLGSDIF